MTVPSAAVFHGASISAALEPRLQNTTPFSKSEKRLTLRSAGVEAGCGVNRPPSAPSCAVTVADAAMLILFGAVTTFRAVIGILPALTASTGSLSKSGGRLANGLRWASGR